MQSEKHDDACSKILKEKFELGFILCLNKRLALCLVFLEELLEWGVLKWKRRQEWDMNFVPSK